MPCHSPAIKTQYPLYRRLGGPQGWSGQVWKISSPLEFNAQSIQPVVMSLNRRIHELKIVSIIECSSIYDWVFQPEGKETAWKT